MPTVEAALSHFSPVVLSEPFCSYCGHQPTDALGRGRVCARCKLGMVLHAPAGGAPRAQDPFLIVDETLTVQAISRRAEAVLGIDETEGVCALVENYVQPADGNLDRLDLELLLQLAVAGRPPSDTLKLRVGANPRRFKARVTSCGRPRGALLVFAPA